MPLRFVIVAFALSALIACSPLDEIGKNPGFTPVDSGSEYTAMSYAGLPEAPRYSRASDRASLWSSSRASLLGDHRARAQGDILTVVINLNDKAEFSNTTGSSSSGSEERTIADFLGIPEAVNSKLGVDLSPGISTSVKSSSNGQGKISRNEKLTLRVAATVTGAMPNGILKISGSQEIRVNYELRELLVTGFVRPEDISRQNEIPYDKIASARISYGGRGYISRQQQPSYGQQLIDIVLPF